MSFLQNKGGATSNKPGAAPARPAGGKREPGRYGGFRPTGGGEGPRLLKGVYDVEVVENRFHEGQANISVVYEVKILKALPGSTNAEGSGAIMRFFRGTKKQLQVSIPRMMSMAEAVMQKPWAEIGDEYPTSDDLIDRLLGDELDEEVFGANPFGGQTLRVEAVPSTNTDANGEPYMNYFFKPAGGAAPGEEG